MRSVCFFLIFVACAYAEENGFLPALETKIQDKFSEYAGYVANWLQSFNDEHLGKSEIGRFLHYDEMKTKLKETKYHAEGRSKKMANNMGMMMPLVFHIGATSTWMLLTTLLAAKSVAVGLLLLVIKIAVSSAKLASFFTHLKHSKQGHHDWKPQWLPHIDHHDHHDSHIEHLPDHHGTISHHTPEWTPNDIPHHFHEYKNNEFHDFKNHEFHDFKNNEFHDFKNHEFHDFKNNDFHDFKNHEFPDFKNNEFHDFKNNELHSDFNFNTHDYKTIPTQDLHGFSDGYHSDFNNFDGAKKKIDTKVG